MTRAWTRVVALMFPSGSLDRYDLVRVTLTGVTEVVVAAEVSYEAFTFVFAIGAPVREGALAALRLRD